MSYAFFSMFCTVTTSSLCRSEVVASIRHINSYKVHDFYNPEYKIFYGSIEKEKLAPSSLI